MGKNKSQYLARSNKNLVTHILEDHAHNKAQSTSYIFLEKGLEKQIYSYKQLYEESLKVAAKLQQLNMSGERVLLLYPSGIDFITAFLGCLYAGAIAVPAYPPHNNRIINRLETIIDDCTPKLILTNKKSELTLAEIKENIPNNHNLENIEFILHEELNDVSHHHYKNQHIKDTDIAFLQYTSGSTSLPKGVMISNFNIIHNLIILKKSLHFDQNSIFVSWLPIYHDMGLIVGLLESLYLGTKTIFMAPADFIRSPLLWLKTISKYKGTFSGAPNFAFDLCTTKRISDADHKKINLSSLKVLVNGSEPLNPVSIEQFYDKFQTYGLSNKTITPSYGMAESTLCIST